jgi:phosphate transport system substrate-binding protein
VIKRLQNVVPVLGLIAAASLSAPVVAADISGAGATFPYPIYAKWAEAYKRETGVGLNYQSIGSGGGIKQIKAATVTFGASDKPLEPAELNEAKLVQFPMVIGGVVPVANIAGIAPGQLELDGPTLASIYLGEITQWNDPRIARLNPQAKLPAQAIAPIYRSDGSGTNFLFTDYLSKVSPTFKSKIGANTSVEWPTGIGAKGNEGVANMTTQTGGAIGYVEYAYAKQNKLAYTKMVNKDGKTVSPTSSAFKAAAVNAVWTSQPGYGVVLANEPGAESWPMTAATWILIHKQPKDAASAGEALKFFAWAYARGGATADALDYVPLPPNVIKLVEQTWSKSIIAGGRPVWSAK